ncbi:hypothetical protein AVEN_51790-1 [Araneus ventricosus]|uniref:RNase H type-1 domain-containing protein n=1 Tax=Araneus ventricosus TaxID=182803 RepID=A0A4Y2M5Z3_ARAVE|nr:hypothetical protein AVEN_51790-1 [Araneus ventricosus]
MLQAIGSVGLSWVKAHAGIPGNELADQYVKIATTNGEELNIPAPYTYVKRKIKNYILDSWQRHWEDSGKGVRAKGLHLSICFPELLPLLNLTAESYLCNSGYFPVIVSHADSGGGIQYPPRYPFQRADCTNFTQMADITESVVGQYTNPNFAAIKNRTEQQSLSFTGRSTLPYNDEFRMFELKTALSQEHDTSHDPD